MNEHTVINVICCELHVDGGTRVTMDECNIEAVTGRALEEHLEQGYSIQICCGYFKQAIK